MIFCYPDKITLPYSAFIFTSFPNLESNKELTYNYTYSFILPKVFLPLTSFYAQDPVLFQYSPLAIQSK